MLLLPVLLYIYVRNVNSSLMVYSDDIYVVVNPKYRV